MASHPFLHDKVTGPIPKHTLHTIPALLNITPNYVTLTAAEGAPERGEDLHG